MLEADNRTMHALTPKSVSLRLNQFLAILAILLVTAQTGSLAEQGKSNPKSPGPKIDGQWVFYGLLLKPAKGEAHWDANAPNFSILDPKDAAVTTPPAKKMVIRCEHAMHLRQSCLAVTPGTPGNYQWGQVTASVQPGMKLKVLAVTALHSPLGLYYWVQIAPAA